MKQESRHPSGGKLRGLFCLGLAAILAVGVAFNGTAANMDAQYDVKVDSAFTHSAALSEGKLYLWGKNNAGQFPNSDLTYSAQPVALATRVADMALSANRTLVVSSDGKLRLYGVEPADDASVPVEGALLAGDAVQVDASDTFAAYVSKSGALYTWGLNHSGQLGVGGTEPSTKPVPVFESGAKKVSVGDSFCLALMEDGSVYGWGNNSSLQLGGESGDPIVDKPILVAQDVADVAAGHSHALLLKTDGSLWACGDNTYNQAGVADGSMCGLTRIMSGVRRVSAGSYHNFAVSTDGTVYAWGYGVSGQLGNGDGQRVATPKATSFDYVQVFACSDNTFGVASDGSIYSFGDNTNFLLGKSDSTDSMTPVLILDKDMNWVYSQTQETEDHEHGAEDPAVAADEPSGSEPDVSEPSGEEISEPEIVTAPFVSGYTDGTFRPVQPVNRAEFLKMVVSALCKDFDESADYGACSFSDVPAKLEDGTEPWYAKYVAFAEGNGVVHGYSDGTFRPTEPITRAEASAIVVSALGGLEPADDPITTFDDVNGHWAADSIYALVSDGALNGYPDGTFRPANNITRAEAVSMIARAARFRPDEERQDALRAEFPISPFPSDVDPGEWYYPYLLRGVGYAEK